MSAPDNMVTEREAVERQRRAYAAGRCDGGFPYKESYALASKLYPLPTTTRPRVVTDCLDPSCAPRSFRLVDGQLQTKCLGDTWHCLDNGSSHATVSGKGVAITPDRIRMLADLLANPTEEVTE